MTMWKRGYRHRTISSSGCWQSNVVFAIFMSPLESRVRTLGILEGISFLLLMFVAMPLKYVFRQPEAVRVVGSLHGALFVLFVLSVLLVALKMRWKLARIVLALAASVLPFGPFIVDKWVWRETKLPT